MSESNTTGAIIWKDFVAEQFLMEPRVPFRLKYDSLEEIEISAVTALNSSIARGIGTGLSKDVMETLSQIVAEWNARYGMAFDTEIAA